MKTKHFLSLIMLSLLFALVIASPLSYAQEKNAYAREASITVFAAASLTEVVGAIAKDFEQETHIKTKCSFASSALLARQIEAGAEADVFISADPAWTEELGKKDLLKKDSPFKFAGNSLVLVSQAAKPFTFAPTQGANLAGAFTGRLAVGDPESVPAGKYAKQALQWMKSWDALSSRLAPAADVRAALRLVATGETNAGIVYKTDALIEPKVKIVAEFPEASHEPIFYSAALHKNAQKGADEFAGLLKGKKALELLKKQGFAPAGAEK